MLNLDGTFHAIDDACTHMGGSLSQGFVQGDDVVCPLHSTRFSISTGEATGLPAEAGVRRYNVRVVGEEIENRGVAGHRAHPARGEQDGGRATRHLGKGGRHGNFHPNR